MSADPRRGGGSGKGTNPTKPRGKLDYLFPGLVAWKTAKLKNEEATLDNKGKGRAANPTGGTSASAKSQFDNRGSLGENEYPSFDARPHRDWDPAPGRIKKCDFCEKRSQHITQKCTQCFVLMCQDCAFNGMWKTDSVHFISPQNVNWEYPGARKPQVSRPGTLPALPDSGGSASKSVDAKNPDASSTKRQVHFASDDDDTIEEDDVLYTQKRQRKTQSSVAHGSSPHSSTIATSKTTVVPNEQEEVEDDEDSDPLSDPPPSDEEEDDEEEEDNDGADYEDDSHSVAGPSNQSQQSAAYREPGAYAVNLTAAAGRTSVRASAAMAMHRMSTPGRRFRDNMNQLASGANDEDEILLQRNRPGMLEHPPLRIRKRAPRTVPHYPMPRKGPYTGPFSSRVREQQVMSLYYDVFGPNVEGYRPMALDLMGIPRTLETDFMKSLGYDDHPLPGVPQREDFRQGRNMRTEPAEHAVYHRLVHEYMMTGDYFDPTRSLPPPPPNYAEDSFHNYPSGRGYTPSLRNTPIWNPMNEMSAEELRIMHDDHFLQTRMADAWRSNRIVMRVREFGLNAWNLANWVPKDGTGPKDFEALQLLWEVAQVRMNRVLLIVAPQTKNWFVNQVQNVFFQEGDGDGEQSGNAGEAGVPGPEMNVNPSADAEVDVDVEMDAPIQGNVGDEDNNEEQDEDIEDDSPENDDEADSDFNPDILSE